MPQRRSNTREKLVNPERLCDVVVGAEIEGPNLTHFIRTN
jgi:hypothetical protein